jgi:hypothetical protein
MAYEAIVIFMMLVRKLVFAVAGLVIALFCAQIGHDMLDGMHRLEYYREQYCNQRDEVYYGKFLLHWRQM